MQFTQVSTNRRCTTRQKVEVKKVIDSIYLLLFVYSFVDLFTIFRLLEAQEWKNKLDKRETEATQEKRRERKRRRRQRGGGGGKRKSRDKRDYDGECEGDKVEGRGNRRQEDRGRGIRRRKHRG